MTTIPKLTWYDRVDEAERVRMIETMVKRIEGWARRMGWTYRHADGLRTVPTWTPTGANLTLRHLTNTSNFQLPDLHLAGQLGRYWVMEENKRDMRVFCSGATTLEAVAPVYERLCEFLGIDPWRLYGADSNI